MSVSIVTWLFFNDQGTRVFSDNSVRMQLAKLSFPLFVSSKNESGFEL